MNGSYQQWLHPVALTDQTNSKTTPVGKETIHWSPAPISAGVLLVGVFDPDLGVNFPPQW